MEWSVLQRAHILAKVWGGTEDVWNYHLLCSICHKISEGRLGVYYWRWLKWQTSHDATLMEAAEQICEETGLSPHQIGRAHGKRLVEIARAIAWRRSFAACPFQLPPDDLGPHPGARQAITRPAG